MFCSWSRNVARNLGKEKEKKKGAFSDRTKHLDGSREKEKKKGTALSKELPFDDAKTFWGDWGGIKFRAHPAKKNLTITVEARQLKSLTFHVSTFDKEHFRAVTYGASDLLSPSPC